MSWRYFTESEFACRCCGESKMDPTFVAMLDELRHRLGQPVVINSGYRCPAHNQRVSSTGPNGPHTTGKAADLRLTGAPAWRAIKIACNLGFAGIGVQQKGAHASRFLHLDILDGPGRPALWSY